MVFSFLFSCLSSLQEERVRASGILNGPDKVCFMWFWTFVFTKKCMNFFFQKNGALGNKSDFIEKIRKALYASKIVSYAQGFMLLREAAENYNWKLNYGGIALMWRGGCIIRSAFLGKIKWVTFSRKKKKMVLHMNLTIILLFQRSLWQSTRVNQFIVRRFFPWRSAWLSKCVAGRYIEIRRNRHSYPGLFDGLGLLWRLPIWQIAS